MQLIRKNTAGKIPLLTGDILVVARDCKISSIQFTKDTIIKINKINRFNAFNFWYISNGRVHKDGDIDLNFDEGNPRLRYPCKNEVKRCVLY